MKKLLLLSLIFASTSNVLFAQSKAKSNVSAQSNVVVKAENKFTVIKELDNQLVSIFGKNYDLKSDAVKKQLEKNIANTNAPYNIRKSSLIAIYGDKASEHANLIGR